jgi:hypothetical protein
MRLGKRERAALKREQAEALAAKGRYARAEALPKWDFETHTYLKVHGRGRVAWGHKPRGKHPRTVTVFV